MSIINTIAAAAFISLSFFMTGACLCWLCFYHKVRIQDADIGFYDVIYKELPGFRRSVRVREAGLVALEIMITAANCICINIGPSVLFACANLLAALLLLVVAKRYFMFIKAAFLLSMHNHHTEKLRELMTTQADEQ